MQIVFSFKKKMIKLPINLTITENTYFYAISTTSDKNMPQFYIIASTFLTSNNDKFVCWFRMYKTLSYTFIFDFQNKPRR